MINLIPLAIDAGSANLAKELAPVAAASLTAQASLVVGVVALVGTIVTAVFAWLNATKAATAQIGAAQTAADAAQVNARTSAYSSTVISERSKWINALRVNIANLSGKVRSLSYKSEAGSLSSDERSDFVAEINELMALITLQLNPFGKIEGNIHAIVKRLPGLAEQANGAALRTLDDLFVEHSRWLLKAEWDKVKTEARSGVTASDDPAYMAKYDAFCLAEGKF